MLNLRWNQIAFGALILIFSAAGFAQAQRKERKATVLRLMDYDTKSLHYGFQIGVFSSNLNTRYSDFFLNSAESSDSTLSISSRRGTSFSLGFVINKSLSDELWDVRLLPSVAFYSYAVDYYFPDRTVTQLVNNTSTFVELPIVFKYRSVRRKNVRMYLIGGIAPGLGVGSKRLQEDPQGLGLNNFNCEITYGVGLEGYMQLFSFAPELRFSHGFINMRKPADNNFSRNLDRLTTHKIGLYFNFEG